MVGECMQPQARIILPDSIREPGTPKNVLFSGRGVNLKTGKEISFKVPDTISLKGLESLEKNVKMSNSYHEYLIGELKELFE